jgi:hypothetical protein
VGKGDFNILGLAKLTFKLNFALPMRKILGFILAQFHIDEVKKQTKKQTKKNEYHT